MALRDLQKIFSYLLQSMVYILRYLILLGFAETDIKIYSLHALLINMFPNVLQKENYMFYETVTQFVKLMLSKLFCFPPSPGSLRIPNLSVLTVDVASDHT